MALRTAFTELLGLRHPIALAPMGGSAGGALAAAVCNAGGLGLLGGGNGDRDWLTRELPSWPAARAGHGESASRAGRWTGARSSWRLSRGRAR